MCSNIPCIWPNDLVKGKGAILGQNCRMAHSRRILTVNTEQSGQLKGLELVWFADP
jgi:hypothetical protein